MFGFCPLSYSGKRRSIFLFLNFAAHCLSKSFGTRDIIGDGNTVDKIKKVTVVLFSSSPLMKLISIDSISLPARGV